MLRDPLRSILLVLGMSDHDIHEVVYELLLGRRAEFCHLLVTAPLDRLASRR